MERFILVNLVLVSFQSVSDRANKSLVIYLGTHFLLVNSLVLGAGEDDDGSRVRGYHSSATAKCESLLN